MPARTPTLEVQADEPQPWPVGVPGARTVEVGVRDRSLAMDATLRYGLVPGSHLVTLGFAVNSEGGIDTPLRDLPFARWDKAARGAAERVLVASGPHSQSVPPDILAELMVDQQFPELKDAAGGNALRRRKSLLHLAQMAAEYSEIQGSGSSNPAQVLGDRYDVSAATVRSWLHRARREGLALGSSHPNAVPR